MEIAESHQQMNANPVAPANAGSPSPRCRMPSARRGCARSDMEQHIAISVPKQTWVGAVVFLLAFCLLGLAAAKYQWLYRDYGTHWPLQNRLASAYGAVAFPMIGVVVALTLFVSEMVLRRVWVRWVLFAIFAFVLGYAFRALFWVPVS